MPAIDRVEGWLARVPFLRRHRMRGVLVVLTAVFGAPLRSGGLSSYTWIAVGTAVLIAGSILHLLSKGFLRRSGELIRSGPYRFVRHPFYLSNLVIDGGICLLGANPCIGVPYLGVLALQTLAVIRREERALEGAHGEAWRRYRAAVPMLIPWKMGPRGGGTASFSTQSLAVELEVPRVLRILAVPPLILLALLLRGDLLDGRGLLDSGLLLKATLLSGGLILRLASLLLRGIPPRKISSQLAATSPEASPQDPSRP